MTQNELMEAVYMYILNEGIAQDSSEVRQARKEAEQTFKKDFLSKDPEKAKRQWIYIADHISDIECLTEKQGFLWGFQCALAMVGGRSDIGCDYFSKIEQ